MRNLIAILLAVLASCGVASADHVAILVDGTKAGSYIVTVDGAGGATVHPLSKVIVVDGPTPTPPPNPPTDLTDRAKAIKAAAEKATGDANRAETAKGLAALYREVAKLVRQGQAKDVPSLVTAVSTATNTFLSSRGTAAAMAWQPTRDVFSGQWTVLTAGNKPLADYAVLLDECAAGLDASAPSLRGITPEMLKFILEILIPLILKLLNLA